MSTNRKIVTDASGYKDRSTKQARARRDNFKAKSKKFFVKENVLYRHVPGNVTGVEVVLAGRVKDILDEFHGSSIGGHSGVNKTIKAIQTHYWWPCLTEDVKSYIRSCERCQKSDPMKPAKKPELHPIKVSQPFELVGVDLVGPLTETESGNKYILTATDYFTKWVEAFPIPSKSAANVSRCLEAMFCRHGAMTAILTDQGREFVNEVNKNLCERWNVKHKVAAAYHPQTNGLDERTNQSIKGALRKVVNDNQTDWDEQLDSVLFSLRTKPHTSTKYTPFFLLYGREAVYPSKLPESLSLDDIEREPSVEDVNHLVGQRQTEAETVKKNVKDNIDKAQERQKKAYRERVNKTRRHEEVNTGDKVLVFNFRKADRKSKSNLQNNYLGPYTVVTIDGKTVTLQNEGGLTLKKKYSIDALKLFKEESVKKAEQEEGVKTTGQEGVKTTGQEGVKTTGQEGVKTTGQQESMKTTWYSEIVQAAVTSGQLNNVIECVNKLAVPNFHNPKQLEELRGEDPVTSFMADVSADHEEDMDRLSAIILPHLRTLDCDLSRKTSLTMLLSALFTKAKMTNTSIVQMCDSLLLHPSHMRRIDQTAGDDLQGDIRLSVGGETLDRADLDTLNDGKWLNDKIINAFLAVLKRERNFENTHVFVLPSYTAVLWDNGRFDHYLFRKVQFLLYDKVLLPVNVNNNHWVLFVADVRERTMFVLDSLAGTAGQKYLDYWRRFLQLREKNVDESLGEWTSVKVPSNLQSDGHSCGVFVMMHAECIMKEVPAVIMRQVHTKKYRTYVRSVLFKDGAQKNDRQCDMPHCSASVKNHQRWVQCTVCGRWLHTRCCKIPTRAALEDEYECVFCVAMYY